MPREVRGRRGRVVAHTCTTCRKAYDLAPLARQCEEKHAARARRKAARERADGQTFIFGDEPAP